MEIINKALKWLYILLFSITPLIVLPVTSELFEFNKIIVIYFLTVLVFFFWSLKSILSRKLTIKKSFLDIPLLIFLASQVLSTVFSIYKQTSIFGYYGRFNGGLVSIIAYIFLYYGFISNFDKGFVRSLLKASLISSFIVIIWGLPGRFNRDLSCLVFTGRFNNSCWTDQFHPELRMFSTVGQPNWLGAYLAINFFIGWFFFLESIVKNKKNHLILNALYLIANFSAILFTRSRSAYLSLAAGIILIVVITARKKINIKKIAGLMVLLLSTVIFFKTGVEKIDRFLRLKTYIKTSQPAKPTKPLGPPLDISESFDIRKIVWQGAVDLGRQYPFFGTGVETFAYSYYFTRPRSHNLTSECDYLYNKAHNEYLNYLATTGFFGIASYLLMVCYLLYFSILNIKNKESKINIKNQKDQKDRVKENDLLNNQQLLIVCLLLAYASILVTNFFGFSTTTINLFFYLIPAFIIVLINQEKNFYEIRLKEKPYLIYVILLLTGFYLLIGTVFYWLADTKYAQGDVYSRSGEYQKAAGLFLEAIKLRNEHIYKDKLSFALANVAYLAFYNKENNKAKRLIVLSDNYNLETLRASPKNILYWKTRAKDQYLFYQTTLKPFYLTNGINSLLTAKKIASTDPKIDYSLAIYYSLLFDEANRMTDKNKYRQLSMEAIYSSLQLKPDYIDALSIKKQLMKKYKMTKE